MTGKAPKRPRDANKLAKRIVEIATSETDDSAIDPLNLPPAGEKNPAAVALGRLGGLKGGKSRANKLSGKQRKDIAKKAALARWSKKTP